MLKLMRGANVFDEIFKLIIAKLFDEKTYLKNDKSVAKFRVGVFESAEDARKRIDDLFEEAAKRWTGIFEENERILLTDESVAYIVSALQKAYLLKSPSDILGAAFEVMVNPEMKGNKGQYFTPRHVVKMCIDIIEPRDRETVFDPACGSGGFLVGAMDNVYKQIEEERDDENDIIENKKDYASECVFGMDYDKTIAKVAKAYMLIWGDGRSNIASCDSLNSNNWDDETIAKFMVGRGNARKLKQFDVIVTNPPFAGDISNDDTLALYELAYKNDKKGNRKKVNKIGKEKLFIERCLNMLVPGGRMAIVLPRGIIKNYTDERIRRYIMEHAIVIGSIGLGGNVFKPFTNTKTIVLFLQKRFVPLESGQTYELGQNHKKMVFCVTEQSGKDKTGKIITDENNNVVSDFDDIVKYFKKNTSFYTEEEYMKMIDEESDRDGTNDNEII